jgi:hypothetical protein
MRGHDELAGQKAAVPASFAGRSELNVLGGASRSPVAEPVIVCPAVRGELLVTTVASIAKET